MANFRKSFSFRNGVQVDDDNLIVNANGLVGIGTSVPTELFDVRGNAKVVGLVTASEIFSTSIRSGIATFTTITDSVGKVRIGFGSIGAITGIVSYYGDGGGLFNIPTSQWIDVDPGYGYSSIYAAGQVGIGTTNPVYWFQVGRNPDTSTGVGFNSIGDIKASGIITASSFRGPLTGTVTGNLVGNVNSSGLSTFTSLSITGNTNSTGIITASIINGNHTGILNANVNATGVSTLPFISATNINASGIITATTFVGGFQGSVTGIAQSAASLTGTPSITVANVIATSLNAGFTTAGIITATNELDVGVGGTAFTALNSGRIGVGTAIPTSDAQIRKAHATLVEVISDNNRARISIGQSVGVGNSSAVLRFADSAKTFDIANNDTGSFNMLLHAGGVGLNTGRFNWIYGQSNAELMSLTYEGRLGIAKTNPDHPLHVVGTSTITGNAFFGGNVNIAGILNAGTVTLPAVLNNTQINNATGISTFNDVQISGNLFTGIGSIGISTSIPTVGLDARTEDGFLARVGINTVAFQDELLNVNGSARFTSVGIGTSSATTGIGVVLVSEFEQYNSYMRLINSSLNLTTGGTLGVGTDTNRAAVDFADAGASITGNIARQMIVPKVTTAQRVGIRTATGGVVYDTTLNQFLGATLVGTGRTDWVNLGVQTGSVNSNQLTTIGLNATGIATASQLVSTIANGTAPLVVTSSTQVTNLNASQLEGSVSSTSVVANTIAKRDASANLVANTFTGSFSGNLTGNVNSSGIVTATQFRVGTGITIGSGIVTATSGFLSGVGTAVQITTVGNKLTFTVNGVGTTTLTLF